jgi:hypothetical protein
VNLSPAPAVVAEEQKNGKEEKAREDIALAKTSANNYTTPSTATSGKDEYKKTEVAKGKKKAANENLASDHNQATNDESANNAKTNTTANGTASQPKRDENTNHNLEFESRAFAKPQDYIKTEIDKSEMLKENIKSFKAELTINENGKVTDVKFLTPFNTCKGCETEMRKILLNMPGWKGQPGQKAVKETVNYIAP